MARSERQKKGANMISRKSAIFFVLTIYLIPWQAQSQTVETDVRCLIASKFFASVEKDQSKKQIAVASAFFFLGRIDARLSPDQLKAQILLPGATIKKTEAGELMTFCARKVQSSQQALMNMKLEPSAAFPKK